MSDDDKRSSDNEIDTQPLDALADQVGVGARHKESQPPIDVGRYLDICKICDSDFTEILRKTDPRIEQLRDMGIGKIWIRFATVAGYEAFMALWVIIGKDESIRIRMPPFSKYKRFQRNQRIRELFELGVRRELIKKDIKKTLCEDVSLRHIDRLCAKCKVDK